MGRLSQIFWVVNWALDWIRIVLFLHFIYGIYRPKYCNTIYIGFFWIITYPLWIAKINVSMQEIKILLSYLNASNKKQFICYYLYVLIYSICLLLTYNTVESTFEYVCYGISHAIIWCLMCFVVIIVRNACYFYLPKLLST